MNTLATKMEPNQDYKQLHAASSFVLQMWKISQTMQIVEKCDNISKCLNLAWSQKSYLGNDKLTCGWALMIFG